jgi:hypothetical protein
MPALANTSNSSPWVTMPAPRPANSAPMRSYTSTCHPARLNSRAAKRPAIEPPITTAFGSVRAFPRPSFMSSPPFDCSPNPIETHLIYRLINYDDVIALCQLLFII